MNKQSISKSFVWAVAMIALALIVGIKYHANALAWIIGGLIFTVGLIYEIVLYREDAEETITPDVIMTIGALTIAIWSAAS